MTELKLNQIFHCCQSPRPPRRHMMGEAICVRVLADVCFFTRLIALMEKN